MRLILTFLLGLTTFYSVGQLSGTYTIGGTSPDYTDISSAISDLNASGVSGPVIFNIRDGVYTEKIDIQFVQGASATNNIVIQSEGQDSSLVTVRYSATSSADNYVLHLDSADYVTVRHLTLEHYNYGTYGARVVVFENGSDHNVFSRLHCIGSQTGTTNREAIYSPTSSDNYNRIEFSTIEGGFWGMYLEGSASTGQDSSFVSTNNKIVSSRFSAKMKNLYGPQFIQTPLSVLELFQGPPLLFYLSLVTGDLGLIRTM